MSPKTTPMHASAAGTHERAVPSRVGASIFADALISRHLRPLTISPRPRLRPQPGHGNHRRNDLEKTVTPRRTAEERIAETSEKVPSQTTKGSAQERFESRVLASAGFVNWQPIRPSSRAEQRTQGAASTASPFVDGRSRRIADVADRGLGRFNWAESGPTRGCLGRYGVDESGSSGALSVTSGQRSQSKEFNWQKEQSSSRRKSSRWSSPGATV